MKYFKSLILLFALFTTLCADAQVVGSGVVGGDKASVTNAGMKSIIPFMLSISGGISNTSTTYGTIASTGPLGNNVSGTETVAETVMPIAGTISHLVASEPGIATGSYAITVIKNGTAATPSCTISSSTPCSDDSDSVNVVAGDRISVRFTPTGTPTASTILGSFLFTASGTANEAPLFSTPETLTFSNSATQFMGFGSSSTSNATEVSVSSVVPTSGVIDRLFLNVRTAPAVSTSWTATLFHETSGNCAAGGSTGLTTLAATITGTGSATQASDLTHSVSVAAGDCISVQISYTGAPTATAGTVGVRWTPTTTSEYPLMVSSATSINTGASTIRWIPANGVSAGVSTESQAYAIVPNAGFTTIATKELYTVQSSLAGGTSARTWTLRQNGTSISPSCSQATTSASCSSTNSGSLTSENYFDLQYTDGTGTGNSSTWNKSSIVMVTQ